MFCTSLNTSLRLQGLSELHRDMDLFVWAWHVEVMANRMEGGHLGGYAVDGNTFLSLIFYSLLWFALIFLEI